MTEEHRTSAGRRSRADGRAARGADPSPGADDAPELAREVPRGRRPAVDEARALERSLREIESRERALLVGVELRGEHDGWTLESSLDELATLAQTAGVAVVGRTAQRLNAPQPSTLIGSGKLEEIKLAVADLGAELVLFDRELTPRQQRNIEKALDVKVIDRTALILDVFAQHARTREGMLQVELAQYQYRLPRLTRMWTHLARQAGGRAGGAGGGVGVRGPGETQLEIDRREIRRRIKFLEGQIEVLRAQRKQTRQRRQRAGLPVVALVGYTNAGKSTLLNALTGSDIYAADQLFATLDPTTRRVTLDDGRVALFTDTVGFIQKLPTELVAAFRATLEEINEAHVLLHVLDATHPDAVRQAETVERVLSELGLDEPPMVVAANKIDRLGGEGAGVSGGAARSAAGRDDYGDFDDLDDEHDGNDDVDPGGGLDDFDQGGSGHPDNHDGGGRAGTEPHAGTERGEDGGALFDDALAALRDLYPDLVPVSAISGAGLPELLAAVATELESRMVSVEVLIPYADGDVVHKIHEHGIVDAEAYEEAGTRLSARVPAWLAGELGGELSAG